jgi:phosphopantothenoylcysteine decarboxylase/phosphopantothenate--cysteine ligase
MAHEHCMLITAGPTHEPIDAVRYIANRSSGRLGICLAEAARDAGWEVTLLLGPVSQPVPPSVRVERFETSTELAALLDKRFPLCDVLVMAAAVADYRPRAPAARKLPRQPGQLLLELEPTPDLVAACAARKRPGQRIVGFALEEPTALEVHAREKLVRKGLDAIVANPLETMGDRHIRATLYTADGRALSPPGTGRLEKGDFARWLIDWLAAH